MKKEFVIFVLAVLLISNFGNAYAEGSTEGSRDSDNSTTNAAARSAAVTASARCEQLQDMRERMKCRLIQSRAAGGYIAPANAVPEACRELRANGPTTAAAAKARCVAYYQKIRTCYQQTSPAAERTCFLRASGVTKDTLADETENRPEKARNVIVALLYKLEKQAEYLNTEDKLDDDKTTEIVSQIVKIKEMILNGETRETIQPEMQILRQLWIDNVVPLRATEHDSETDDDAQEDDLNEDDDGDTTQ